MGGFCLVIYFYFGFVEVWLILYFLNKKSLNILSVFIRMSTTIYKPTLPLHSLYWLLGGIFLGLFFVISIYYGSISGSSQQAQFEFYGIPFLILGALWLGDDALFFLFGKKKNLTIETSSFILGDSLYSYTDIVSILEALNIGRVTFTLQNGDRIKLSTNIYPDLTWYESILEKILPRITSEILQKLQNQETVKF